MDYYNIYCFIIYIKQTMQIVHELVLYLVRVHIGD